MKLDFTEEEIKKAIEQADANINFEEVKLAGLESETEDKNIDNKVYRKELNEEQRR